MPDEAVIMETEPGEEQEGESEPNPDREDPVIARAKITELEGRLAEKDTELAQANDRLAEMETTIAELEARLTRAIASYRTLVSAAHSEVPEELINGKTIEDIDVSLEKAQSLVSRVRQGLETEAMSSRVPPGAPLRTGLDLSGLSPREKILYGIGGKK